MFDLFQPGALEYAMFAFGIAFGLYGLAVASELRLPFLGILRRPNLATRVLFLIFSVGLIGAALVKSRDVYRPTIDKDLIWDGRDSLQATQVAADGTDVYVLTLNGNVFRVVRGARETIDTGTGTRQILSAGGMLYVLKETGNIWSFLFHERPSGSLTRIDSSTTNTRMISASGEVLYVLKDDGELWRRASRTDDEFDAEDNDFDRVLPPGEPGEKIAQIASSGGVLYYRTAAGRIGTYLPHSEAVADNEDPVIDNCGKAKSIAVDGRSVYLVGHDGGARLCTSGQPQVLFEPSKTNVAEQIDASDGIAYLLTSTGEIWRFAPGAVPKRYKDQSADDEFGVVSISATAFGCYARDYRGRVWRFSEQLTRKSNDQAGN